MELVLDPNYLIRGLSVVMLTYLGWHLLRGP